MEIGKKEGNQGTNQNNSLYYMLTPMESQEKLKVSNQR